MRKIRYLTSIFLIAAILTFIGEMFVWNIDSFETEYIVTTMYLPKDVSQQKMLTDIEEKAKAHHCLVFAVNRNLETIHSEIVSIYGMDKTEEILQKNSSIRKGKYKSIFLGQIEVEFKDFSQIPDVNEISSYYFIGKMEDARAFKSEMINIYDGNFPKEGYIYQHSARNAVCIWGVGILFLLLMTLYETMLLKKETAVRFIYGESLKAIVLKRILCDILLRRTGVSECLYG